MYTVSIMDTLQQESLLKVIGSAPIDENFEQSHMETNLQENECIDLTQDPECFICNAKITDHNKCYTLLGKLAPTKTVIAQKIADLVGSRFILQCSKYEYVCHTCFSLLNKLDNYHLQVKNLEKSLNDILERTHGLSNKLEENCEINPELFATNSEKKQGYLIGSPHASKSVAFVHPQAALVHKNKEGPLEQSQSTNVKNKKVVHIQMSNPPNILKGKDARSVESQNILNANKNFLLHMTKQGGLAESSSNSNSPKKLDLLSKLKKVPFPNMEKKLCNEPGITAHMKNNFLNATYTSVKPINVICANVPNVSNVSKNSNLSEPNTKQPMKRSSLPIIKTVENVSNFRVARKRKPDDNKKFVITTGIKDLKTKYSGSKSESLLEEPLPKHPRYQPVNVKQPTYIINDKGNKICQLDNISGLKFSGDYQNMSMPSNSPQKFNVVKRGKTACSDQRGSKEKDPRNTEDSKHKTIITDTEGTFTYYIVKSENEVVPVDQGLKLKSTGENKQGKSITPSGEHFQNTEQRLEVTDNSSLLLSEQINNYTDTSMKNIAFKKHDRTINVEGKIVSIDQKKEELSENFIEKEVEETNTQLYDFSKIENITGPSIVGSINPLENTDPTSTSTTIPISQNPIPSDFGVDEQNESFGGNDPVPTADGTDNFVTYVYEQLNVGNPIEKTDNDVKPATSTSFDLSSSKKDPVVLLEQLPGPYETAPSDATYPYQPVDVGNEILFDENGQQMILIIPTDEFADQELDSR